MRKFEYVSRVIKNNLYKQFKLPMRATKASAGYDFINPEKISIKPKEIIYIKTGIKVQMQDDEVLILANRSSNAKKKGLVKITGIGVIDADYYNNLGNEGEISFAFMNITDKEIIIEAGEKLGQGIFTKYLLVDNDNTTTERVGGFGSTGK